MACEVVEGVELKYLSMYLGCTNLYNILGTYSIYIGRLLCYDILIWGKPFYFY